MAPCHRPVAKKTINLFRLVRACPFRLPPRGMYEVVPEPGAQGDVPPPPELLDGPGGVGQVEVLQEPEAEEPPQADGHVAVATEVEVDLEGIAYRPQPGQAEVQLGRCQGEDRVGHRPGGVGQEYLLPEAGDEPAQAGQGQLRGQAPVLDLVGHVVVDDDGPGDELGEEGDVEQQPPGIPGPLLRMAVDVNDVAQALEGIKGDADGQHDPRQGQPGSGEAVDRADEEIRVLEDAQQQEVGRHSQPRRQAAVGLPGLEPQAEEVVEKDAQEQQGQIGELPEGEEDQAGQGEPGVPQGQPRQEPVAQIGHRQEHKQENR